MRCEWQSWYSCRARARWHVGVGTRQTDTQLSCSKHLAMTCRVMLTAENRKNATLTITPAREQEESK